MFFYNFIITIKDLFKYLWEKLKELRQNIKFIKDDLNTDETLEEKKEDPSKINPNILPGILILVFFCGLFLVTGCSKHHNFKIVNNYWRNPTYQTKENQLEMDLVVYKRFKDERGNNSILEYRLV